MVPAEPYAACSSLCGRWPCRPPCLGVPVRVPRIFQQPLHWAGPIGRVLAVLAPQPLQAPQQGLVGAILLEAG
eukprot:10880899-Lingulodinium_polyedra.AAC.1